MKTAGRVGYGIVDSHLFACPAVHQGIDVARAPGLVWLRGENDEAETVNDFLSRAMREAADAGFAKIEISGFMNTEGGDARRYTEDSEQR